MDAKVEEAVLRQQYLLAWLDRERNTVKSLTLESQPFPEAQLKGGADAAFVRVAEQTPGQVSLYDLIQEDHTTQNGLKNWYQRKFCFSRPDILFGAVRTPDDAYAPTGRSRREVVT
jgi:hypothetical protein